MPTGEPQHYHIYKHTGRYAPSGSEELLFWNHKARRWRLAPSKGCLYSSAASAHKAVAKSQAESRVFVGNQWGQPVDKHGKLIA